MLQTSRPTHRDEKPFARRKPHASLQMDIRVEALGAHAHLLG